MTHEEPWDTAARLDEARAALRPSGGEREGQRPSGGEREGQRPGGGSAWGPLLDAVRGMVALHVGDPATALAAFDDAEADPVHPIARAIAHFGRALAGLLGADGDPTALAAVDDAIDEARRCMPRYVSTLQLVVAHALADCGRPQMVRYVRPVLDAPQVGVAGEPEERLLRLRADLVAGMVPPAEEVKAHLLELVERHLRRSAGLHALRIARDYDRLDLPGEGDALRQWGVKMLPHPRACTLWELILSAQPAGPAGAPPGPPATFPTPRTGAVVRVLEPRLVLEVDGTAVPLRHTAAKLLLALVIRHPRPMNIEEVADLLWPGAAPRDVRSRLNTLVHRLRSTAPALGAGVRRTGDLLGFDGTNCAVDLLAYRQRLSASTQERRDALASVRGNLCEAQFPYDEQLVDERHAFTATWLNHARGLVATGATTATDLAGPLTMLGLEVTDLTG
jgi:hypothetical protein